MKKWRISRRRATEEEHPASDGVFADIISSLTRQKHFDSPGELASGAKPLKHFHNIAFILRSLSLLCFFWRPE